MVSYRRFRVAQLFSLGGFTLMATNTQFPDRLIGKWAVVSSQTPGEQQLGGEILDEWIISPDSLCCDAGPLHVRKVEVKEEPHQALVLVSFTNGLQYAFMSSKSQPDTILVIFYGDGIEKMRCAITQAVYSKDEPAA